MLKTWTDKKENSKGEYSLIEGIRLFILREKALYANLNLLNIKNEIYEGYYWAPE